MGCAASTASHAVSAPRIGKDGAETKGKKRDVQGTYRERLGDDFIREFAKSHDSIRRRMSDRPDMSTEGSQASAASTLSHEDVPSMHARHSWSTTGTLVSPYATPPQSSLPDHNESGPISGPVSANSAPKDADGPYISSGKHSRSVSREGSRERLEGISRLDRKSQDHASMQRNGVPHRLQPLSRSASVNSSNAAPGGPLFI